MNQRFKLRFLVIPAAIISIAALGYAVWTFYHMQRTTIPNMYTQWWAGSMVVEYLREHNNQWPESWEDLEPTFEKLAEESGRPWTFQEIKSRVVIQWNVDVEEIRVMSEPPSNLIVLRDGGEEHWAGQEPNEMVWLYLQESD